MKLKIGILFFQIEVLNYLKLMKSKMPFKRLKNGGILQFTMGIKHKMLQSF